MTYLSEHFTTWHLANMSGVTAPEEHDGIGFDPPQDRRDGSPGAAMLRSVAESYLERVQWDHDNYGDDDLDDIAHESADSGPSVYTWPMWQQFTDLAAWTLEGDAAEYGTADDATLEDRARLCLYAASLNLCNALAAELAELADQ